MTNREAITVLDQATAKIPLNREGHILVSEAVRTIGAFIDQHDPLPTNTPTATPPKTDGKKNK